MRDPVELEWTKPERFELGHAELNQGLHRHYVM
jgi:hypothetical protein